MNPSAEPEIDQLRRRVAELEAQLAAACGGGDSAAEAQVRFVMDHVPALLSYITPDQVYRHTNECYRKWIDRDPADLIGHTIGEMVGEPHLTNSQPWIRRVLAGEAVSYESQMKRLDGTLRDITVTYTPDFGEDGTVRGFATLVQDISERKRIERQLRQLNHSLQHRVEEFTTLFEIAPVGIGYALDRECRVVRSNAALAKILSVPVDENPSKTGPMPEALPFRAFHEGVEPRPEDLPMQFAARTGVAVRDYELTILRSDGSAVELLSYADPLFDESGNPRGCVAVFVEITERKRSERVVAELSQRLQLHLDNTPLAVVEYTPDFRILRWSREAEKIFGWTAADVVGKRYDEFRWVYQADVPAISATVGRMLDGSAPQTVVSNRNYTRSGRVLQMEWYNSTLTDETGNLRSVLCFGLDITARKEAESALRLNEQRLRTALCHAPLIVYNQDLDLRYTWIQNAAFGYSAEQVVGLRDEDVLERPEDAARLSAIKRRVLESGQGIRTEVELWSGGRPFALRLTVEPLQDEKGAITGITCAAVDITETRRTVDALRESEERWRALTQALPVLVRTTGPDGYSDYLNDRWLEYTGQSLDQAIGYGWTDVVHPEDLSAMRIVWNRAVAAVEPYDVHYRIRRALDGEYRWHLVRAWPLKDKAGNVTKWIGTSTDIHDHKNLLQRLAESNEDLRRANHDLEQFAWAAAHDLQEPLRTLSVYNQILGKRYKGKLDNEADMFIGFCVDAAQRMQALVGDLLSYTRLSAVPDRPPETLRVNQIATEVLASLEGAIRESGALISVGELPPVSGHSGRVFQLLQNLISNAIKYRIPGRAPVIEVSARQEGRIVRFEVRDDGLGIAREYQERIFGVFKRLHGKEVPGTGIGLAICRRIVELYGGKLEVQSEGEGKGSTFTFTLPAAK